MQGAYGITANARKILQGLKPICFRFLVMKITFIGLSAKGHQIPLIVNESRKR